MNNRNGQTLQYDKENRLITATLGVTTTAYAYNADGQRVKQLITVSGVTTTTLYVGNYYEVTLPTNSVTKYYYFGAQRVAMRNTNGVTYLHGDNLGSTSATSGAQNSKQWYYAFGGVRATEGTLPTDYTYTGQKADSYIKLIQMGARWYDSDLGRFAQPDSIIPNPYNPQNLNRYSYVLNNPIRYTDPTGHCSIDEETGKCEKLDYTYLHVVQGLGFEPSGLEEWSKNDLNYFLGWLRAGVRFTNNTANYMNQCNQGVAWTADALASAREALKLISDYVTSVGGNVMEALGLVGGGTFIINSVAVPTGYAGWHDSANNQINVLISAQDFIGVVIHEAGHAIDYNYGNGGTIGVGGYWSARAREWLGVAGWQNNPGTGWSHSNPVADPGKNNPLENFADVFRGAIRESSNYDQYKQQVDALNAMLAKIQ